MVPVPPLDNSDFVEFQMFLKMADQTLRSLNHLNILHYYDHGKNIIGQLLARFRCVIFFTGLSKFWTCLNLFILLFVISFDRSILDITFFDFANLYDLY